MRKIRVCCNDGHIKDCHKFDSFEDVIEWAKNEIRKNSSLKIGDKVKVINTGRCHTHISKESLYQFYLDNPYEIGESLEIASEINHDALGYLNGVKELPDDVFEVVAIFKNKNFVFIKPCNRIKYHGYYIIEKEGLKKC